MKAHLLFQIYRLLHQYITIHVHDIKNMKIVFQFNIAIAVKPEFQNTVSKATFTSFL